MDFGTIVRGTSEAILLAPISRIQILLQTQDVIPTLKHGKPMNGVIDCFSRIKNEEGFRSLWRGAAPLIFVEVIKQAAQTIVSGRYKEIISELTEQQKPNPQNPNKFDSVSVEYKKTITVKQLDPSQNPLAAPGIPLVAFNLASAMIVYPFMVLRTRIGADYGRRSQRQYPGMIQATKNLINAGGVQALYKGFTPFLVFTLLNDIVYKHYVAGKENVNTSFILHFANDLALFPLIVLSNRLMMQTGNPSIKYKGFIECCQKTFRDFGVKGFYQGFQINAFIFGIAGSIFLLNSFTEKRQEGQ